MYYVFVIMHFSDRSYVCRDGHAVITNSDWVVLCPPTEDVTSQSTIIIPGEPSEPLPSEEIGMHKNHFYVCNIKISISYMFFSF